MEYLLSDIIERFGIGDEKAIEFGVEFGFSTVALSSYFSKVIGIDTFQGDKHTEDHLDVYEEVKELMPENVELIRTDYRDYDTEEHFDLAHVDIVHTYEDTFACGDWAMRHADIVLFHDTESFPEVKRAVTDLATKYQVEFHNYPFHHGLGILCTK